MCIKRTSSTLQTQPEPLRPLPSTFHSTPVCTVHSINDHIINVVTHWSWGIRGYYHESTSMGSSSAKCSHTHSLGPHTHMSIPTLTSPINEIRRKRHSKTNTNLSSSILWEYTTTPASNHKQEQCLCSGKYGRGWKKNIGFTDKLLHHHRCKHPSTCDVE